MQGGYAGFKAGLREEIAQPIREFVETAAAGGDFEMVEGLADD